MTGLIEVLRETERRLADAGIESARVDSRILVSHATGIARDRLVVPAGVALSPEHRARIAEITARRAAREPVALITGRREFWSLEFQVNRATLIPRPDSETLIEAVLERRPDRMDHTRVLDLGTGSGCLLLALLSELPNATGLGIDASAEALAVAAANAQALGFAGRAAFAKDDWGALLNERFDVILANPPYIATDDWARLDDDVRLFEPQTALLAGPDGLGAYRSLLPHVVRLLAPDGLFVGEFGAGQAFGVVDAAQTAGLRVIELRRDLAGVERCLLATGTENDGGGKTKCLKSCN